MCVDDNKVVSSRLYVHNMITALTSNEMCHNSLRSKMLMWPDVKCRDNESSFFNLVQGRFLVGLWPKLPKMARVFQFLGPLVTWIDAPKSWCWHCKRDYQPRVRYHHPCIVPQSLDIWLALISNTSPPEREPVLQRILVGPSRVK